jgi:3-hydroxybutyryl-CoA dehydrogenase
MTHSTVGIIGAGAMGSGIAQVAAQAGWNVVLMDQSNDVLTHSSAALAKVCNRLVEKGRITADESVALQLRIDRTTEIQKLSSCILVIEAIVENVTVKQKVFASLENVVSKACLIATNTSSLSVTGLASSLQHPERFLGLHFFNPAPLMQLVEVVPAMQTDLSHIPRCIDWMSQWGKTPVQAKDTPGFIVNRLARPFYGEALRIVEEELATTSEVDAAMKAIGFRMGPFELMDLIGNDINYAVTVSVFEAFYFDPRYRPSLIQKQHVEAGWLGRKSGRGYYRYDGAPVASSEPNAMKDPEWIQHRIVSMLINEAADALSLRIATAADLELAMTRGVNYPKGLLAWANEWGVESVLGHLQRLQERYGEDRYRPAPLLRDMAANNQSFNLEQE